MFGKMENKHNELLMCHRAKFVQSVEVERLYPILQNSGVLSAQDTEEIARITTSHGKVEKLLDILPSKGNQAFKSLCLALETTYPHLLTVMFLGSNVGSSQSTASPYTSESEAESEHKSPRLVLPPTQQYCSHDLCEENVRLLKAESKLISDERDQIRRELDHYKRRVMQQQNSGSVGSVGSMDDPGMTPRHRHDSHSNRDYDRLKEECQKAKNDLETLNSLYLEISHKCTNYATVCERQTRELHSFKQECFDLKVEKGRAQQDIVDLKQLHNDDKRELSMLREMINHKGSSEVLNKMYDTALEKYESMKKSYDDLRRRYLDKEEELSRLRSKFDLVQHERDQVVKDSNDMKQKLKTMITNREELIRERERERDQYRAGKLKSDRQRDEVRKEMDNARKVLILAKKDLARVTLERNDAIEEYRRVMSERDVVHKEIEALQDELQAEKNARTKYDGVKNSSLNEIKSLKIEIAALMKSRDQAIKQKQELQEQCNETISDKAEVQKQRDDALNDFEKYRYERDVARKERTEAIDERDQILRECYNVKQRQQSASSNVEHLYKEVERLNKLLEKCKEELREANQDAAIAKQRRDWAFSERDKIVLERESVRKMCDKLRRQRDRAVSELGESLRDSDDVQRQRSDAMKELRVIKEKLQIQEEKQSRMSLTHLVAHHSRDSAIDADSTEWETETVELECQKEDVSDFGFEIGNAKENPQSPDDCSIYVSRVDKGSIADGRLRVNDCLMKVNDVDLTNVDPSFAIKAVKSGGGVLNMVIKRRRPSSGKALQSIHLNLTGRKDIGLSLEQGIFISRVAPNSVAAQGNLTVGDRVIYVNGSPIENKTASDVEKLLESTGDSIALSILRSPTTSTVSGNSMFDSLHDKDSDSTKSNLQYSSSHGEIMEEIKTQLQNVKNMCVQTDNGIVPTLQNGAYCEYLNHESHSSRALPAEPEVTVISRPKESPKYRDPPVFRVPPPPIESPDDDNKLASLPQMKKHPSTRYKKAWPKEKESSGTWPKSRGAPELYEVKGGGVYISHRKSKERVTIANGYEWRRYIEIPTKDNIKGSGEIPPIPPDRISSLNHSSFNKHSRQSSTHSSDSASTIVADSITPKHTPTPSGASTITMTSNHLHAVPPQNNGNEYKHFPTLSTPDTTMDYSVVSASDINEDPRPKSAPLKRKENHPHTVRAEMIQKPTTLDIAKPNIYKPVVSPLVNSDSSLTVCRAEAKISPSPVYVNGTQIRTSPHSYPIETHATTTVVTFKDVPFFTAKSKNIERNDGPAIASKPPTPRFLNHSSSPRSSITPQDIDRKRRTSPCPETHSDGYISSPNTSRRELNQSLDFTRRSPIHSPLRNSPHSFEMRDGHQSLPYYSRIKIPSASRVSPGPHSSTGSIEQVSISDRSSPISPTIPEHSVPSTSSDGSLSRLSIHSIQFSAKADRTEYNGINLRCATYGQAANILRLGGDSINILAQYNPKKMEDDTDSSCSSVNSTLTPTPQSTATNSPTTSHSQMDMSFMSETGTMTPPTPRASICSSARSHDQDMMSSGMSLCEPPRFVMLQKINR
ncbi:disks large homolog 5-like, partial [Saccoglossus kowalevskii]